MIDMKMTPEEAKAEYGAPTASGDPDLPKYPYGLSLSLCDEILAKLGIGLMPVGTTLALRAVVEVTSQGLREDQDGKDLNMQLQITQMELVTAGTDESRASKLWPTDK